MRGIRLLISMLRADVYGSGAFGPEVARAARVLAAYGRVARWVIGMGILGLTVGFLESLWLDPEVEDAGVGMAVTGPLGLVGGLAWGLWRKRARLSGRDATRPTGRPA